MDYGFAAVRLLHVLSTVLWIGIAVVNTWLQDNARLETARLGEPLGQSAGAVTAAVTELGHRLAAVTPDAAQALMMARALIGRTVGREALTLAFDDVFRLMAWIFIAALVMVPFAKSAGSSAAPPAEAH